MTSPARTSEIISALLLRFTLQSPCGGHKAVAKAKALPMTQRLELKHGARDRRARPRADQKGGHSLLC